MKPPASAAEVESQIRRLNALFLLGGALFLLLTFGFLFRLPWTAGLWPLAAGQHSFFFLASITAAVAAPLLWIGLTGEHGAAAGGAVNLAVTAAGAALYLFWLFIERRQPQYFLLSFIMILFFVINGWIFDWSRSRPQRDQRPVPPLLKIYFCLFASLLLLVATGLILRFPFIFPWPLDPDSSVLFGLIFLGAAAYFGYALLFPGWTNARGQLTGFLAYDLVLIGPLLRLFSSVPPERRLSLAVYTFLLVFSGLLAVYYLFVNPSTRGRAVEGRQTPLAE